MRIFEYHRSHLHAKVAVVDDSWATVGSSNIDPFSLLLARGPVAVGALAEGERAPRRPAAGSEASMETFRVEVGHVHGAKPGNLVGAIANEAGLESRHIGRIDIRGDHSLIDLPVGMPDELMQHLKQVWVAGQRLKIARASAADKAASSNERPAPRPRAPGGARFERGDSKPGGFKGKPGGGFKGRPRG